MTATLAPVGPAVQAEKETLGQRIARLLKNQGRRQCDLAQACRVDVTTANKWIKGVAHPRFPVMPSIATYLGLTLGELVDDLAPAEGESPDKEAA